MDLLPMLSFLTLCDYAYPIATENIYNTNESLIGDCYGRYQVMATDKFKSGQIFAAHNAPRELVKLAACR